MQQEIDGERTLVGLLAGFRALALNSLGSTIGVVGNGVAGVPDGVRQSAENHVVGNM